MTSDDGWQCTNTWEKATRKNLQKWAPPKTDCWSFQRGQDKKWWSQKKATDVKNNVGKGEHKEKENCLTVTEKKGDIWLIRVTWQSI